MIYITGNQGYIGSYLSEYFPKSEGCDIGWFSGETGIDFCLAPEISDAEFIIHLAGHSSEPMCSHDPISAWHNNVDKFKVLVENLSPNQTLIYASSASVYEANPGTVDEKSFVSSSRPYDCTKIVCDSIAQMHINQGKKIVGLRFGTVAGCSPIQRIDTVINAMTLSAITTGIIKCVDPHIRRTMLFLPDLPQAIEKVIGNPIPGIYNLGSCNTDVGTIGSVVSRVTSADMDIIRTNSNFYDFHLDCNKFVDTYGGYVSTTIVETVAELQKHLPAAKKGRRDAVPT